MARVKICGLSRPEDIQAVNRSKPDYVGFVFADSRRKVTVESAAKLKSQLLPSIPVVGVFVNAPIGEIVRIGEMGIIDFVQLHGGEDETYVEGLKRALPLPIIKAIRAKSQSHIRAADGLPCDYLLLDTYLPGTYGGSGIPFDWEMIPPLTHPFFLAGGLTMETLKEAAATGAYCLDLSSAAETKGAKDPDKVEKIVNMIRSIDQCQTENSETTADNLFQKP